MTNDPTTPPDAPADLAAALSARAGRGAPRGAEAVLAGARTDGPGLGDGSSLEDAPDRRARRATLAAAALVVAGLAAGGAALAVRSDGGGTASRADDPGPPTFCEALAVPVELSPEGAPDLIVYLPPGSSPAEVAGMLGALEGDGRVASAAYVDRTATLATFRELFADEPAMLDSVSADDLPTSFEVALADPTTADGLASELRTRPDVYEVRAGSVAGVRVLDLLVWPGHDPGFTSKLLAGPAAALHGEAWDRQVASVRAASTPEVAGAVDHLVAAIDEDRAGTSEAEAAAAELEAAASAACDLVPLGTFRGPPSTPATSPTTTSPPIPDGD